MKHLHRAQHSLKWFSRQKKVLAPIIMLIVVGIGSLSFALHTSGGTSSPEVQFTDASHSGLSIVPASGCSDPNGCQPYTCGTSGRQNQIETCTCNTGYTGTPPDCTPIPQTCPANYTGTYPNCTPPPLPFCPSGYSGVYPDCSAPGPGSCPLGYSGTYPDCTPPSGCPIGYLTDPLTGFCVYDQCPAGFTLNALGVCVSDPVCPSGYTGMYPDCTAPAPVCTPQYLCGADGNLYYKDASCNLTATPSQACGYGCSGGACLPPPAPSVTSFTVSPILVQSGKTVTVSWSVQDATGCTVTGSNGDGPWSGLSGSETSAPITAQTVYTLHCGVISGAKNQLGNDAVWSDQSVTVNIAPVFRER